MCSFRGVLIVAGTCNGWHRPVVFSDAGPEDPDHYYREQGEEGLEETPVDLAVGAFTDVHADYVLEDLANGEEDGSSKEVYCE